MKRFCSLCFLLLLFSCTALADTVLMQVTDLHFLAPSLYEGSELFSQALLHGDGKVTDRSDILLSAMEKEVMSVHPDALILSGDLTFNGEKQSHVLLSECLRRIQDSGIAVYVIPGNHDMNMPNACAFSRYSYARTESVSASEFRDIYAPFLPAHDGSMRLGGWAEVGDVVLLLVDGAIYEPVSLTGGFIPAETLQAVRHVLETVQETGKAVISVTHHSLIPHADLMQESFVLRNASALLSLYQTYKVPLNLSGHLHLQHIAQSQGVTDAATGAFSLFPHHYGLITVSEDTIRYESRTLSPQHVPEGFLEESANFFVTVTALKIQPVLETLDLTFSQKADMLRLACEVNLAYFSGLLGSSGTAWQEDPGYALWTAHRTDLLEAQYIAGILETERQDQINVTLACASASPEGR